MSLSPSFFSFFFLSRVVAAVSRAAQEEIKKSIFAYALRYLEHEEGGQNSSWIPFSLVEEEEEGRRRRT